MQACIRNLCKWYELSKYLGIYARTHARTHTPIQKQFVHWNIWILCLFKGSGYTVK